MASPVANAALVVVLPTPPLPEVTTTILLKDRHSCLMLFIPLNGQLAPNKIISEYYQKPTTLLAENPENIRTLV
jgi:hypothetical protein